MLCVNTMDKIQTGTRYVNECEYEYEHGHATEGYQYAYSGAVRSFIKYK